MAKIELLKFCDFLSVTKELFRYYHIIVSLNNKY